MCQRAEQIPPGKQCKTKNSTREIEVMTRAVRETPLHPGEKMKCFRNVRKHDHYQTSGAEQLQERGCRFVSGEQHDRAGKQQASR